MAEMHLGDGLEQDDDGFYVFNCTCGWKEWGLPDLETLIDSAMDHAAEMAWREAIGANE